MTSTATSKAATTSGTYPARQGSLGKAVAVAAVGSVVVNVVIAAIALGPLDASSDFRPLTPGGYVFLTVIGVIVGALGAPSPAALQTRFAPAAGSSRPSSRSHSP